MTDSAYCEYEAVPDHNNTTGAHTITFFAAYTAAGGGSPSYGTTLENISVVSISSALAYKRDSAAITNFTVTPSSTGWGSSAITISFSLTEPLSSYNIYAKKPNTEEWVNLGHITQITYNATSDNGEYKYKAVSGVGFEMESTTTINIQIDLVDPVVTYVSGKPNISGDTWNYSTQLIYVNATDDVSGISKFEVYKRSYAAAKLEEGDDFYKDAALDEDAIISLGGGVYVINISTYDQHLIKVIDNAGHITNTIVRYGGADVKVIQERVDAVSPVATNLVGADYYDMDSWTNAASIKLGLSVPYVPSGISVSISYNAGGSWTVITSRDSWDALQDSEKSTEPLIAEVERQYQDDSNTSYIFRISYGDGSGAKTYTLNRSIKWDRTAPVFDQPYLDTLWNSAMDVVNGTTWAHVPYTFQFTATDNISGIFATATLSYNTSSSDFSAETLNKPTDTKKSRFKCIFDTKSNGDSFVITIKDLAGNVATLNLTPKLDDATVAVSSIEYKYGAESADFSAMTSYDGSTWINGNNIIKAQATINLTPSLYSGKLIFELGYDTAWTKLEEMTEYNGSSFATSTMTISITINFAITNDTNAAMYLRIRTDSVNYIPVLSNAQQIKIDKGNPTLVSESYVSNQSTYTTKADIEGNWSAATFAVTLALKDTTSAISIYNIYALDYTTDINDFMGTLDVSNSYTGNNSISYTYDMQDYLRFNIDAYYAYLVVFIDEAKNLGYYSIVPKLDNTKLSVTVEPSAGYVSGAWTYSDVIFKLTIVKEGGESVSSAPEIQYTTVDEPGENDWIKVTTKWNDEDGVYKLEVNYSINTNFYFRAYNLVSKSAISNNYLVKLDKEGATFSSTTMSTPDGKTYESGSWTYQSVTIRLALNIGISGGRLYIHYSNDQYSTIPPLTQADTWSQVYTSSVATQYTYALSGITSTQYIYYALESNNTVLTHWWCSVAYDPTTLSWNNFFITAGGSSYTPGAWTSKIPTVDFTVSSAGSAISGIKAYYRTSSTADFTDETYTEITMSLETYSLTISNPSDLYYEFSARTGAGYEVVYSTKPRIMFDDVKPDFDVTISATQAADGTEWYTSNVNLTYNVKSTHISGHVLHYRRRQFTAGSSFAELVSYNNTIVIDANMSGSGASVWVYELYIVSGSGVTSDVISPGWARDDVKVIAIDLSTYYITAQGYLAETSVTYSSNTNTGPSYLYKRGDSVNVDIICQTGHYIKQIDIIKSSTDESKNSKSTYTQGDKIDNIRIPVEFSESSSPQLKIYYYKQIQISYNGLTGSLQATNFAGPTPSIHTSTSLPTGFPTVSFDIKYDGEALKRQVGQYSLTIAIRIPETPSQLDTLMKDSLILIEPTEPKDKLFTVRYFTTQGSSVNAPYQISTPTDLSYVKIYSTQDTSLAYLGNIGASAYYRQLANINVLETSTDYLVDNLYGTYDGNNYNIVLPSSEFYTYRGVFGKIHGTIKDLGVLGDSNISDENSIVSGLLAGEVATGGSVSGCYALGSITLKDSTSNTYPVILGGLIGKLTNASMQNSYADVRITIEDDSRVMFVGGLVGEITDNATLQGNYVSSYIYRINDNTTTSSIGAVVAKYTGASAPTIASNVYMKNALIVVDEFLDLPFGEQSYTDNGQQFSCETYDQFLENETSIGNSNIEARLPLVMNLIRVRINALSITGEGTTSNPFIITSYAEFRHIESFPWANFRQTDYIFYNDSPIRTPFAGTYDAANPENGSYAIYKLNINSLSNGTAGLFSVLHGATISNLTLSDATIDISESSSTDVYVGILAGRALAGTEISNIIIDGAINLSDDLSGKPVFVGGLVGTLTASSVQNVVTTATISSSAAFTIAGGSIGQAESQSQIENVVSLGEVKVDAASASWAGGAVGRVFTSDVTGSSIYAIADSVYISGYAMDAAVGASNSTLITAGTTNYESLLANAANMTLTGITVSKILEDLSVFESGTGRASDPFIIMNFKQLLAIENYLYARFKLGASITIGAFDVVDMNYVFKSIGDGKTFMGELDGNGYSISGLTAPLFYAVAGAVRNVTLNVNMKIVSEGSEELQLPAYANATKVERGSSVVIGSVARYALPDSVVASVIVSGDIDIRIYGQGIVTLGGIVGISSGGRISNSTVGAKLNVKASTIDAGAIVGEITGPTVLSLAIILSPITLQGSVVKAGFVVGAIRSREAEISDGAEQIGVDSMSSLNINGNPSPSTALYGSDYR
ncbi:MAG: hypothetical protein LBE09_08615 [Christensenellaceae bacterium]|nr:hypothetical protein [Christensenellaceae bacterium]